jgi:hypothetical protein
MISAWLALLILGQAPYCRMVEGDVPVSRVAGRAAIVDEHEPKSFPARTLPASLTTKKPAGKAAARPAPTFIYTPPPVVVSQARPASTYYAVPMYHAAPPYSGGPSCVGGSCAAPATGFRPFGGGFR